MSDDDLMKTTPVFDMADYQDAQFEEYATFPDARDDCPEWVKVGDWVPKYGQPVLVKRQGSGRAWLAYNEADEWRSAEWKDGGGIIEVLLVRALPAIPPEVRE